MAISTGWFGGLPKQPYGLMEKIWRSPVDMVDIYIYYITYVNILFFHRVHICQVVQDFLNHEQ